MASQLLSQAQREAFEAKIGYRFKDPMLLSAAFTHCSAVQNGGEGPGHNQRLEFLGDAVLEMCISEHLYLGFPEMPEGRLTKTRAGIVSEGALAAAAGKLSLGAHLIIGRGEELTGGREKPSILADASEALIGAVYLDGGLNSARRFVLRFLGNQIKEAVEAGGIRDYKTELQEAAHRAGLGECSYRTTCETGPDHRKEFVVQVIIGGEVRGEGGGQSKKAAEQQAARAALMRLPL
ncbi:MAG: ribonuclease III [Christensenellales bacterium]|jgi:ribonuclease-3